MDEGFDAPFGAVDRFAIELGVSGDDPRRIEAGIRFELSYNATMGHSFLPKEKLIIASSQLLGLEASSISDGIVRLLEAEQVYEDRLAGIQICYLPALYNAELACKQHLLSAANAPATAPSNLKKLLRELEKESGITYADSQIEAITSAVSSKLLVISGGPGTGKSATRFCVK